MMLMTRIKELALIVLAIILTGCQTPVGQLWKATSNQDPFTDRVTKMVTVGDFRATSSIFTSSLKYYPFVGMHNGDLHVGIRSGGRYRVPTGTVQIRIDDNPAWTINPDETPLGFVPAVPSLDGITIPGSIVNVNEIQKNVAGNMAKMLSPYTAATGHKAKSIIREMLNGKIVIYRTIGLNQAASTTGEVMIDDSFEKSLRLIGINPENL